MLSPRFALRSGHVTIGGSICMDLLTMSGWSPVNSIESVLIQIRTEMVTGANMALLLLLRFSRTGV